jgi:hypothetical protein
MSLPAQKSAMQAQPLIAVRNVRTSIRWYAELLEADSVLEHSHRDVYDRISCSGRLLLQRKTTPISSMQTRRRLDTASCCDSKWTLLTRLWSEHTGWGPRLSKSLTSTLAPDTGRFGSATPTVMSW